MYIILSTYLSAYYYLSAILLKSIALHYHYNIKYIIFSFYAFIYTSTYMHIYAVIIAKMHIYTSYIYNNTLTHLHNTLYNYAYNLPVNLAELYTAVCKLI